MCRIDAYSARMPFAPSRRLASRAMFVAMLTLLRLASDTCCGVILPRSLRRPRCSDTSCALHDLAHHLGETRLLQLERRRAACRT